MLFNKSTENSIIILLYLNKIKEDDFLTAEQIARAVSLPKEYTSKILQNLAKNKIVESQKGRGGGFRIIIDQNNIKLGDLINVFEKNTFYSRCIIGVSDQCNNCTCPMHYTWEILKEQITNTKILEIQKSNIFYN